MTTMRTTEPTRITTGEKVEWRREFCGYPATEWTLLYRFRGPGTGVDLSCGPDETVPEAFLATLLPVDTLVFDVAGNYRWNAIATNIADTNNVVVVGTGFTQVILGLSDSTDAIETRSIAKQIVDAIDAALLRSSDAVIEYEEATPAGSHRVKRSREDAMKTRSHYAAIVAMEMANERGRNGKPVMGSIKMRVFER